MVVGRNWKSLVGRDLSQFVSNLVGVEATDGTDVRKHSAEEEGPASISDFIRPSWPHQIFGANVEGERFVDVDAEEHNPESNCDAHRVNHEELEFLSRFADVETVSNGVGQGDDLRDHDEDGDVVGDVDRVRCMTSVEWFSCEE